MIILQRHLINVVEGQVIFFDSKQKSPFQDKGTRSS